MILLILLIVYLNLPSVTAEWWDDFSNNFATDLAPLLSLFGEQVTKQYLSESIYILDYFIFAMAPLGILTAVVSVIRTCGSPSLRAFIGRAQEGRGIAEAELCSSTSRDACELYSNGGIARVFGRPKILEIIFDPDEPDFTKTAGVYTIRDYLETRKEKSIWEKQSKFSTRHFTSDNEAVREKKSVYGDSEVDLLAPNLSLNVGIKRQPLYVSWLVAIMGFILQTGVLLFAGAVTYYLKWEKDGKTPSSYACPLVFAGTTLVSIGGFSCAFLIGESTDEEVFHRKQNKADGRFVDTPIMIWVQPGGQVLGDQTFDPFCYSDYRKPSEQYLTSWKKPSGESTLYVWTAISITMLGFILQFTGLRGIHSAVSLAQTGVVLTMSMARSALRTQRLKLEDNRFGGFPDMVTGYELDWLALHLGSKDIQRDPDPSDPAVHSLTKLDTSLPQSRYHAHNNQSTLETQNPAPLSQQNDNRHFWTFYGTSETNILTMTQLSSAPPNDGNSSPAGKIFSYRARLAQLTKSPTSKTRSATSAASFNLEMVEVRQEAQRLAVAIETALDNLFPGKDKNECLREEGKSKLTYTISSSLTRSQAHEIPIRRIVSTTEEVQSLNVWLPRGIFNFKEHTLRLGPSKPEPASLWEKFNVSQYRPLPGKLWEGPARPPVVRYFGWHIRSISKYADPSQTSELKIVSSHTNTTLVSSCAQEVFGSFLTSVLDKVPKQEDAKIVQDDGEFRLTSKIVSIMSNCFTEGQLGTIEEAMLCILPPIISRLSYPPSRSCLAAARKSADESRKRGEWHDAKAVLEWAWHICMASPEAHDEAIEDDTSRAATALGELYRWSLMDITQQQFAINGVNWLKVQMTRSLTKPCRRVIDLYHTVLKTVLEENKNNHNEYPDIMNELTETLVYITSSASKMTEETKGKILCQAAKNGWLEVLLSMLELGTSSDFKDSSSRTALSYAAEEGHVGIINELLNWGAYPGFPDNKQATPLFYASEAGRGSIVQILLEDQRVFPDQRDQDKQTPLHRAAANGHETIINLLLSSGKVDPDAFDKLEFTPLHLAADRGHQEVAKQLLKIGKADPNALNYRAHTPLQRAAQGGHDAVFRLLLATGKVNPDFEDKDGRRPIHDAAKGGHLTIVRLLLATNQVNPDARVNSVESPLHEAARGGHEAIFRLLLGTGKVNLNHKGSHGKLPIHMAASGGSEGIVRLLLTSGEVDPDARCSDGETALHHAAREGHEPLVRLLLATGKVDINSRCNEGSTALDRAAYWGHEAIVRFLLATGKADPDAKLSNGNTALHQAALYGRAGVMRILLATGQVDINAKTEDGETPLHIAVFRNDKDIVKLLLATGMADLGARNRFGKTPIERTLHESTISLFKSHDMDSYAKHGGE